MGEYTKETREEKLDLSLEEVVTLVPIRNINNSHRLCIVHPRNSFFLVFMFQALHLITLGHHHRKASLFVICINQFLT
jgi:hypothetical protein